MLLASLSMLLLTAAMYHWIFRKGALERWPAIGLLVHLVVQVEFDQRSSVREAPDRPA